MIMSGDGGMSADRVSGLSNGSSLAAAGSGTSIRRERHCRDPFGLRRVAIALAVSGCNYAPTMDLFGSYFPAWMLCAALGIVTAIIIRQILALMGINDYVVAPLLTYAALAVSATLLAWLLWFGH
jgi:YtcA family